MATGRTQPTAHVEGIIEIEPSSNEGGLFENLRQTVEIARETNKVLGKGPLAREGWMVADAWLYNENRDNWESSILGKPTEKDPSATIRRRSFLGITLPEKLGFATEVPNDQQLDVQKRNVWNTFVNPNTGAMSSKSQRVSDFEETLKYQKSNTGLLASIADVVKKAPELRESANRQTQEQLGKIAGKHVRESIVSETPGKLEQIRRLQQYLGIPNLPPSTPRLLIKKSIMCNALQDVSTRYHAGYVRLGSPIPARALLETVFGGLILIDAGVVNNINDIETLDAEIKRYETEIFGIRNPQNSKEI